MKETPKVRGERPRRSVNSFLAPALLYGRITKTEANLDWQSKAPTHNSQISTSRDTVKTRGKKRFVKACLLLLLYTTFVVVVDEDGALLGRREAYVVDTPASFYQRRDLGYPGDDDGKSEGVEAPRVLLVAKNTAPNPLAHSVKSTHEDDAAKGTSQGNNTDSLVGLPRKVIAAARLH